MKIHSMLPFLERDEINTLIDQVLEKKVDMKLVHVLPYADEEEMNHVLDRALHDDSVVVYVKELLPFLNKEQMEKLYEAYEEGLIQTGKVCEGDMIPYLGREKIKKIFDEKLAKMKLHIKEEIKDAMKEVKKELKQVSKELKTKDE